MLKMPAPRYALKLADSWHSATQRTGRRRHYQIYDLDGLPLKPAQSQNGTATSCYMTLYSLGAETRTPARVSQHDRVAPVWDEHNNAPSVLTLYCTQSFNQATRLSQDAAQSLTRAAWKRGLSLEMVPVGLSGWIHQQQERLLAWVNRKAGEPPRGLKQPLK